MDLRAALGEKFDPEAKYELYDASKPHGTPGKLVSEVRDTVNNRMLVVYDVRGGSPAAEPKTLGRTRSR